METLYGRPYLHRIMGIRAEERYRRARRERTAQIGRTRQYNPIWGWQEWHIWDFIEEKSLPYPSLYDEGFSRIGCIICPFFMHKNQTKLNMHRSRWPATYRVFERVVTDWFLNYNTKRQEGFSDQTPEEYLEGYYRGFES